MQLSYRITPDPLHHRYHVTLPLDLSHLEEESIRLEMPVWTPGSYVLREYSGRVCDIHAESAGVRIELEQIGKAEWRLHADETPDLSRVEVHWSVFAYSKGIHDAWLDVDRGFINPPALFLHPAAIPQGTLFSVLFDVKDWDVHSALDALQTPDGTSWQAKSLDELLDSPFVLLPKKGAKATIFIVDAGSVPHEVIITGASSLNTKRIAEDLRKIFEAANLFWHDPKVIAEPRAPFSRYMLYLHLEAGLYGGLEHSAGTALLEDVNALPAAGEAEPPKRYDEFLILAAHEYFHAWLVKRLKPSGFLPYDLSGEEYTHDLWIFEGFTSYYESLLARRARVISEEVYLRHLAERMNFALTREGFDAMTLAESSFNAWVKLYRQTEDSPYSQISYYTKGALAALILDSEIRRLTERKETLESFLQTWYCSAADEIRQGTWKGLPDGGIGELFKSLIHVDLSELLGMLVYEKRNRSFWIDAVEKALNLQGLQTEADPTVPAALRLAGIHPGKKRGAVVAGYVVSSSPAFAAGLFAGDEIIAVDEEKTDASVFERQIERARGRRVRIHFFRGPRLLSGILDLKSRPDPEFLGLLPKRIVPLQKSEG